MVTIRWLGTAGIELNHKGRIILIDPYLSRLKKADIFLCRLVPRTQTIDAYLDALEGELGAIVCGHTHFDHALDIPRLARRTGATVIGCASLDALLATSGLPGRVMISYLERPVSLDRDATVTLIPSLHGLILGRLLLFEGVIDRNRTPPLRAHQYRLGAMNTVKVELGGVSFMHIGSAGFLEHALETHRCDVLFLCAAGWKTTKGYPEKVIEKVRPSVVVPVHYDDFSLPLETGREFRVLRSADINAFMERLRGTRHPVRVLRVEPYAEISF